MTVNPDNLVRGWVSWAGDESDPSFEARWDPSDRWNGWLCPYFDKRACDELVAYNEGGEDIDTFTWDGDVLVDHYPPGTMPEGEDNFERIEPTIIDGVPYWTPGSYSWTWMEVYRPLTADEVEAIGADTRFGDRDLIHEGNLTPAEWRLLSAYLRAKVEKEVTHAQAVA